MSNNQIVPAGSLKNSGSLGESNSLLMNVALHFSVIKQELVAIYEKDGEEQYKILIAPQEKMTGEALTITEAINDVEQFLNKFKPGFNFASINTAIGSLGKNISLGLKAAFLYVDKKSANSTDVEYAFGVKVICENFSILPGVDIKSASVSFWNTERKSVKESLGLEKISDILEKYK